MVEASLRYKKLPLFVHQILRQFRFQLLQSDLAIKAGIAEIHGSGRPDGERFFGHVAAADAGMVGLVGPLVDLQSVSGAG